MNKLKTVPTSSNNLEPKENITDVDKLKTVSVDYKNLSNVVENETVKKTVSWISENGNSTNDKISSKLGLLINQTLILIS